MERNNALYHEAYKIALDFIAKRQQEAGYIPKAAYWNDDNKLEPLLLKQNYIDVLGFRFYYVDYAGKVGYDAVKVQGNHEERKGENQMPRKAAALAQDPIVAEIDEKGKPRRVKKAAVLEEQLAEPQVAEVKGALEAQKKMMAEADDLEKEAKAKMEAARKEREDAVKALEAHLNPVRERISELTKEFNTHLDKYKELTAKAKEHRTLATSAKSALEEIYKEAEAQGIPRVLLGVKKVKKARHDRKANGKTTLKPEFIGAFEPIVVTAGKRHGDRTRETTIMIKCTGQEFFAKRLENYNAGDVVEDAGYTVNSRRMSDVTTQPGWVETKDVAYAIISHLGKLDEFPAITPVSDPANILVFGEPLRDADYVFEVVEAIEF